MIRWSAVYAENKDCKGKEFKEIRALEESGYPSLKVQVPGNLELDLMRAGKLPDIYYGDQILKARELENIHIWYYAEIELSDENEYLHFTGIDTVADIYINGVLARSVDNMMMEYDVFGAYRVGKNEVIVHIKPACY